MTFLAPLYIAGLTALALPIIFHLIRRTPQGRQAFSSLMFLQPSPPRLTRRSRLSNILLLILRGLAVTLLALAFARPFFQNRAQAEPGSGKSKRVAILVDTSASMRRDDLWNQAKAQVDDALKDVSATNDEVGLFFFDRGVRPAMTFAEWNDLDPSKRVAVLKGRVEEATPTWHSTALGEALATTADLLAEAEGSRGGVTPSGGRQLVLISDVQQGSRAETLQGHQWPEHVTLAVKTVAPAKGKATNAAVQAVRETTVDPSDDGSRLRVRVVSQPGATTEQFTLRWADAKGPLANVQPIQAYAPAGRSQIVRVPWPGPGQHADRLVLEGDDADFDNTLYVVRPQREDVRVVYAGSDKPDDPAGLQFYYRSAAGDTVQRKVDIVVKRDDEQLAEPDLLGARLFVVAGSSSVVAREALAQRFADSGGDVLLVLTDAKPGVAEALAKLIGGDAVGVEESVGKNFSLIGRVDVRHPLFAPFADARLGDFTKIHFWKHRRVTLPPNTSAHVLATFDGGDPFLIELPVGRGRIFILTSGWQPADSQLALSTKFVPLMEGWLRRRDGAVVGGQFAVGDPIPLPAPVVNASTTAPAVSRALVDPDGKPLPLAADATVFTEADRPGVYRLTFNGEEQPIAVNLASEESRTAPLAVEDLERWGAKVGKATPPEDLVTRQRQLQRAELENRQKLWQWLIAGVLVLLAAETFVAGRLAHRAPTEPVATA